MTNIIDAHIHLDQYTDNEIKKMINGHNRLEGLITVSTSLDSCIRNHNLAQEYSKVHAAYGFHPEQPLPSEGDRQGLFDWLSLHQKEMVAVGEVGLPFYMRKEQGGENFLLEEYIDLLESFICLAKKWDKPVVLHAVYEDAPIVCNLLEKHSYSKAHFHWFKGDHKTVERMIRNGYYISITPDVLYEKEIQQIVQTYPINQMMVETDGPWPFEGPFKGKRTHPKMIEETYKSIANIKGLSEMEISAQMLQNTKEFYSL